MTENSKYNIWAQATRNNPHALYRRMRQEDPVFRVIDGLGQTVWFFTRYEDSVAVLKDRRIIKDIRQGIRKSNYFLAVERRAAIRKGLSLIKRAHKTHAIRLSILYCLLQLHQADEDQQLKL